MTEPKTATKRKSSTSLHSSISSQKLTVTVRTSKKQRNRIIYLHCLYFFKRCCRCMYTTDAHTFSNGGKFLLSSTRTTSIPIVISGCILAHTGMASASNKQFLHQNLYYEILCMNQRNIFEVKQRYFPFPSVRKEQLSEYFIFAWYVDTVCFNGTFVFLEPPEIPNIICKNTLYSQKIKSSVASSHMQMHLTAPSGAKKWFYPGLLVEVMLLPLTHQHVCQPWQPRIHIWVLKLLPSQALSDIGSSRFNPVLNHTHRAAMIQQPPAPLMLAAAATQPLTTGHKYLLLCGRQRHSLQLLKRLTVQTAAPHLS